MNGHEDEHDDCAWQWNEKENTIEQTKPDITASTAASVFAGFATYGIGFLE